MRGSSFNYHRPKIVGIYYGGVLLAYDVLTGEFLSKPEKIMGTFLLDDVVLLIMAGRYIIGSRESHIMSCCTSVGRCVFYLIGDSFVLFVVYPIDVYEFDRKVVSRIRGLALRIGESCRDLELKSSLQRQS